MKVSVILPAYNEEDSVEKVIEGIYSAIGRDTEIIVVDDSSVDGTAKIAQECGARVIRNPYNMGNGAAIKRGIREASCDIVVLMDADGQHHPADAEKLIGAIPEDMRPVIIGARQGMETKTVPWTSRSGRAFSNFWVWVSGGPRVSDSQSGFRLYPLPETLHLPVAARRFQYEVEVLVRAVQQNIPVLETPVRVVYQPKGERISHFRPFIDFCRNSATFARLITGRIVTGIFRR